MDSANDKNPSVNAFIPGARLTLQVDPAKVVGCRGCDGVGKVVGGSDSDGEVSFDVVEPCELCGGTGEQHCEADGCGEAVTRQLTVGAERALCCDSTDCTFELTYDVLKRAHGRAIAMQQMLRRKVVSFGPR